MDLEQFLADWRSDSPTVVVHTSGSTGRPKAMLVEKRRMEASARITCQFLGLQAGDSALLCMSLDYIAGKMMVVRALTCGLHLLTVPPSGHPLRESVEPLLADMASAPPLAFAAMVPLQVYNSLQVPEERQRLMQIRHLIIGGGAIDAAMEAELKTFPNAVWSTYGMTETLSHIALRRLSGPEASEWYTPFDGVTLSTTADGCLVIDAPAVHDGPLVTNDIVELVPRYSRGDSAGTCSFRIVGRKDNVVCSGGIKIQIEEVERLLRPHLAGPFCITKRPDAKFGEAVVLLTEGSADEGRSTCRQVLPKHWVPRSFFTVARIPMTETGKVARREAATLAATLAAK